MSGKLNFSIFRSLRRVQEQESFDNKRLHLEPYQLAQEAISQSARAASSSSSSLQGDVIAVDQKQMRLQKLLKAIQDDSQPLFYKHYEEFVENKKIADEVALAILDSPLELPSDIVSLIPEEMISVFLEKQLNNSPNKNYCLISSALILELEKGKVKDVLEYLNKLLKTGDDAGVHFLIDLIQDEIPKKSRPSFLQTTYTQLSYVMGYIKWMTFNYSPVVFENSQAVLDRIFQKENIETVISSANTDNLEYLSAFRDAHSKEISLTKLIEKKIPPYFINNKEAFDFFYLSDTFSAIEYYGDEFILNTKQEPMIQVEGRLTQVSQVLERFTLEPAKLGSKNIYRIVEKASGQRFSYLQQGLVPHDDETSICVVHKAPASKRWTVSICSTDHGDSSSPEGIKRLLGMHSWVRLEDDEGNVYSVGLWGGGKLHSPDLYQRTLLPKNVNTIQVSQEGFNQILDSIKLEQLDRVQNPGHFNLINHNCSCFAESIAKKALEFAQKPPADMWGFEDISDCIQLSKIVSSCQSLDLLQTFETRIKTFFAAKQIVEELFEKKEQGLDDLHKLKHDLEKISISKKSRDWLFIASTGLDILANQLTGSNIQALHRLNSLIFALKSCYRAEELSALLHASISIIDELIAEITQDGKAACINKLFNLEMAIINKLKEVQIHHPYILFNHLSSAEFDPFVQSQSRVRKF
jgi:hypothetical protein